MHWVVIVIVSTARICRSATMMKLEPNHQCEASSELLFGESITILEQGVQWCKVRSNRDGYEGHIETASIALNASSATHRVCVKATLIFSRPDIKSPVIRRVLFGSELSLGALDTTDDFQEERNGGYVWSAHCLANCASIDSSPVQIAQHMYLHAPYLWAGRSTDGCDCSGMIQMVARACGIELPRDSSDQERYLSSDVDYDQRSAEDVVFWPGHVGLLKAADTLIHATAHSMQCCVEPLEQVIHRAGAPSSVKRLVR